MVELIPDGFEMDSLTMKLAKLETWHQQPQRFWREDHEPVETVSRSWLSSVLIYGRQPWIEFRRKL